MLPVKDAPVKTFQAAKLPLRLDSMLLFMEMVVPGKKLLLKSHVPAVECGPIVDESTGTLCVVEPDLAGIDYAARLVRGTVL